jgi:ferredoxin
MLIGDCASDPPLGATQRALAAARPLEVVYGLGAVALARGHERMALAVADEAARAALARAIAAIGADVALLDVADAWPAVAAGERDELLPASALAAVADEAHGRPAAATVSVVGALAQPTVLACAPSTTMAELVALAGGALDDDWLPIAGGAPAGRLVAREATLAEAGAPSMVLVLPARHAWVRRLRTTVGDWLWRAASACEGCRACSDACPASLQAHALVATLATARGDGTAPAAFAACTGCGVCDAACPASLSPRALAVDVRERLGRGGVAAVAATTLRAGIDRALLTLRLGLSAYDRQPVVKLA